MARGIDVYQVVRSFAQRNKLAEIDYKAFAQSVQRQAKLADQAEPVFRDLSLNPDVILVPRLFSLGRGIRFLPRRRVKPVPVRKARGVRRG